MSAMCCPTSSQSDYQGGISALIVFFGTRYNSAHTIHHEHEGCPRGRYPLCSWLGEKTTSSVELNKTHGVNCFVTADEGWSISKFALLVGVLCASRCAKFGDY